MTDDKITGQLVPPGPGDVLIETEGGPAVRLAADD